MIDHEADLARMNSGPDRVEAGPGIAELPWPLLRRVGLAASAVLFAILCAWSVRLYLVSGLSTDAGIYRQAFFEIAHGHLNPYNTMLARGATDYGAPFLQNHLELAMWPLSLIGLIYDHSITLLVIQDICAAGAVLVAYLWGLDILGERWHGSRRGGILVALLLLITLVANPWVYWASLINFHLQALAALFLLLAAREMWTRGRPRAWVWVIGVLACGDVAATYVVGLGISRLLAGRSARRQGAALVVIGASWLAIVAALHANLGSSLPSAYGYLSGSNTLPGGAAALLAIGVGIFRHPSAPARMIGQHATDLYRVLAGPGFIGIMSPEAAGVAVVVLLANVLNAGGFLQPNISFQSFPAEMFIAVGGVFVLCWLWRRSRRVRILAGLLAVASLVQTLVIATAWTPNLFASLLKINATTSNELAIVRSEVPASAEVVITPMIIGRFAARRWVYPFLGLRTIGSSPALRMDLKEPVSARQVVFVVDEKASPGIGSAPPNVVAFAVRYLRDDLHARLVVDRDGIVVLSWRPPRGVRSITFPVPLKVLFPHGAIHAAH